VLEDASLTGTGQSSADVLGVPGDVIVAALTGHLIREIVTRGTPDTPLFPLASQLNHDATHVQGQGLEDMFGQLASAQTPPPRRWRRRWRNFRRWQRDSPVTMMSWRSWRSC
jgi:hypothetical protein